MISSSDPVRAAPRRRAAPGRAPLGGARLLRHPLTWLLLLAGGGLILAAGALAGHQQMTVGTPAERLYLRDGFDGPETAPAGAFRWTHATAGIALPHAGPGPLTVHLTIFDAGPTPRPLRITLDGAEIYAGATRPGGVPWTLDVPAVAATADPLLGVAVPPWTPPGDRRALGVAVLAVAADSPAAADRARAAAAAWVVAVLVLAGAVAGRTGRVVPSALAGLAVLGLWGSLLAYGDVWLNAAAPAVLAGGLVAALLIARAPDGPVAAGRAAGWGTLALVALLLLLTLGRFNTGDAEGMYQVTAGLAEDGRPWQHSTHAPIKFGLGQPLATLPLYGLGRAWAAAAHADPGPLTRFCVALLNQAVIPATALLLFLGARRRYGPGVALALAATFLLATPALPYARLAFAEPLSGLLVLAAFLLLWTSQPRAGARPGVGEAKAPLPPAGALALAGLALGLAVLVKPANAIYLPVPALYLLWRFRRAARPAGGTPEPGAARPAPAGAGTWLRAVILPLASFALGLLPGLLLTAAYNVWRYGSLFTFGYEGEGFTTPLPTGLYGLIASPGKGLIWYAPVLLLVPLALLVQWRDRQPQARAEVLCVAAQAAGVLVFYALWSSWEGNIAWGPRLVLPVVPLLLWPLGGLAGRPGARAAWGLLGVAGFLVAIPGTLVDQFYYFDINGVYDAGTAAEQQMLFAPAWSPIVAHWRFLLTATREAVGRPTLAAMGLPAGWDTAVPVALVAVALGALVLALGGRRPAPDTAGK